MKKTYIAPEVEIKRFNTEDIMNGSVAYTTVDTNGNDNSVITVDYNSLFGNSAN